MATVTAKNPSTSSGDICEKLIAEVQHHQALYDPGCKDYHDAPLKENLWISIATRIDIDEETCRKKWRNLRDQYMKKKKKLTTVSGQAASRIRKWKYMNIMDFLVPYIADRETESNLSQGHGRVDGQQQLPVVDEAASENEEDGERHGDSVIEMGSTSNSRPDVSEASLASIPHAGTSPSDGTSCTPGSRVFKRQKKRNDFEETMLEYFKHRHKMSVSKAGSNPKGGNPKDEDELFMLSCVPTLKKLTPYKKMELKCKIQQLLLEYTPSDISPDRETLSDHSQPSSFPDQSSHLPSYPNHSYMSSMSFNEPNMYVNM